MPYRPSPISDDDREILRAAGYGTLAGLALGALVWVLFRDPVDDPNIIRGEPAVVDGDTFDVGGRRVRLWGIDAPEAGTRAGDQATAFLRRYAAGAEVVCIDTGGRTSGRTVAVCILDGRDLAAATVAAGHARGWPKYSGGFYGREK